MAAARMPGASRPKRARMTSGFACWMNCVGTPRESTRVSGLMSWMAVAMDAPMPPSRRPSSTVRTTPWVAASRIMAGSSGAQQRTSYKVAATPESARVSTTDSAAATILPMARMAIDLSPVVSCKDVMPLPTLFASTLRALPFG